MNSKRAMGILVPVLVGIPLIYFGRAYLGGPAPAAIEASPVLPPVVIIAPEHPRPAVAATAPATVRPQPALVRVPLSAADLFKQMSPSVVRIISLGSKGEPLSQGSGFILTRDLIATNYHVVKGSSGLSVLLDGNATIQVLGIAALDPDGDVALVKVAGAVPPALKLAENLPRVGTRSYAIGNPLGLTNTLSEGLISGLRKESPSLTFLQTTTPISPGSSGGPLINEEGNVLGVTTLCFLDGQNLNFAVESARIRRLLDSYRGAVTQVMKQNWVPTRGQRDEASWWLSKAREETLRVRGPQGTLYAAIATDFADLGNREGCLRTLELWKMCIGNENLGWYQDAQAAGLRARAGDVAGALKALAAASNVRERIYGHVFIAKALAAAGDAAGYDQQMALALNEASAQTDPIIRGDVLVVIVKTLADAGRFPKASAACALLADTDNPNLDSQGAPSGYRRNGKSVAQAHIGIALARAGQFKEAQALAAHVFDRTDRAFLTLSIIEAMAESGHGEQALKVAQAIDIPRFKARSFPGIARIALNQNNRTLGRTAIESARSAARELTEGDQLGFACGLIEVLALGGEFDSAETLSAALPNEASRSAALAQIALAWARRGDYSQMIRTLARVRNHFEAISAYSEISIVQAKDGHLKAACQTAAMIPVRMARGEAIQAIMKATSGKASPDQMAAVIAAFHTPEERAAGYLGWAEGMIDAQTGNIVSGQQTSTNAGE
jgi:S1-C subfamily serine protease